MDDPRSSDGTSLSAKRAAAIEWLGARWVLHPSRRIPKGSYKEPVVQRVDVAATFKAFRKRGLDA
jgi:hypothetical protein